MSSRLVLRRFTAKALSSLMAETLLRLDSSAFWEGLSKGHGISDQEMGSLRQQVHHDLDEVREQGRRERDMLMLAVEQILARFRPGGKSP